MNTKSNENLFTLIIIFSIVILPLAEFFALIFAIFIHDKYGISFSCKFFYQEELLSAIGIIICILLITCFLKDKFFHIESGKKGMVLSDLFVVLSIVFCIISIFFSKDLNKSLHGETAYSETPLQVLAYYSLFFVCTLVTKKENKKTILEVLMALAIFESIIAFLQNFGMWPVSSLFDPKSHELGHMAFGLTEHCNFFAAISIVFTAIFAGNYMYTSSKKASYISLLFATICCLATFFTYTRIGWVGIFSVLFGIFFLGKFINKKNKDEVLSKKNTIKFAVLCIIFLVCFLVVGITSGQILSDLLASRRELFDFNEFGTKRGTIWKVGLSSLKQYPLTGVGFDNYRFSFKIYPENFGWSQNKGHNEYIHTLVTQGIPSGINYLLFAFYCCYFPFKKILEEKTDFGKSYITKIFLIALFAYFVQALFNSSVTNVAPYKWILMGLLLPRIEQKNLKDLLWNKK